MSDNTRLPLGTEDGDIYASDDIAGVKFQRVKLALGADGTDDGDVATGNKLPVSASIAAAQTLANVTTVGTITNVVHVDDNSSTLSIDDGAGNISIDDGGNVITVDGTVNAVTTNAGTFAVQVDGSALTSLQLIDDVVYTDDTSTHATGTSKGALLMAAATPTDSAVNANDIGAVAMTTDRKLHVSVQDALPAGSAAIGKLAANTGVTIGAVEIAAAQTLSTVTTVGTVTTITNSVATLDVPDATSTYAPTNATSTAYETSRVIKGSAGVLFTITGYNSRATSQFIQLHNTTSVPADTAVPVITFLVSGSSNFSLDFGGKFGRFFSTGITVSNSSTGPTKTIGSADCWFDAQYK